jgi:hypothetical protein
MTLESLKWYDLGPLSRSNHRFVRGVYLLVHHGSAKRVVYVGESQNRASGCAQRLRRFREDLLEGEKTVWRAGGEDDIYDLMAHRKTADYRWLAEDGNLWIPGDPLDVGAVDDVFEQQWRHFIASQYVPLLHVWACPLLRPDSEILESQIQYALSQRFGIGYYHDSSVCTFVGRLERPDQDQRCSQHFQFVNLPDVDEGHPGGSL